MITKGKYMQKTGAQLPAIKLVGIKCRTNNQSEQNPATAKIGSMVQQYFQTAIPENIANRIEPMTTYCVYTEYDSDHAGDYTFFIGEAVTSFAHIPEGLFSISIPTQDYIKFTNGPGAMPEVCIRIWKKIWQMTPKELGGTRSYLADFEIYDVRAADPNNTVLDVYIGVN